LHHLGGSPPDLHPDRGAKALVPPLRIRAASPPCKSGSECAENDCGLRMWAAVRAPHHWLVSDALLVEDGCVGRVSLDLARVHGNSAVIASVGGVKTGDADVQRLETRTKGACEDVRRPQPSARNEARCL
jgi:hypothetical protein